MSTEIQYDVHGKVGVVYIFGCLLLGLAIGAIIPFVADQLGVLHLGVMTQGDHHFQFKNAQFFGIVGATFGLINGIALAIRLSLWKVGLMLAVVPCGIFGGFAGHATPHPFSPLGTALTFFVIPFLISGTSIELRKIVWKRYQQPVRTHSSKTG